MEILITAAAARDLGEALTAMEDITPVLLEDDGTLSRGGTPVTEDQIAPRASWISLDLLFSPHAGAYFKMVLASSSLEWIQSSMAGFDNPVFGRIAEKGIRLSTSDAQAVAISEYVMASVLADFQGVDLRRANQRDSEWRLTGFREISGTTWMIVGIGAIGNEVAKRARAFGVHVIGVKRSDTPTEADETIRPAAMKDRLGECDVVVFTSPLNQETRHMGNADFFAAMKQGATFVNIGRGGLVDEPALLAALDRDHLGGAILDVFETEPLPKESPFWTHPKVRATPHSSPISDGTEVRRRAQFLRNLRAFADGNPVGNEVSAETVLAS